MDDQKQTYNYNHFTISAGESFQKKEARLFKKLLNDANIVENEYIKKPIVALPTGYLEKLVAEGVLKRKNK